MMPRGFFTDQVRTSQPAARKISASVVAMVSSPPTFRCGLWIWSIRMASGFWLVTLNSIV
jgi:hypothetical protein